MAARDRAMPSPRSLSLLEQILARTPTTVAILSGRPLAELEVRFAGVGVHLIGDYGWERRLSGRAYERAPLAPDARAALSRAESLAREEGLGAQLEVKRAGVALHVRGLPADAAEASEHRVEILWRPLLAEGGLQLVRFDGGIELAVRGRDKGIAIRELLALEPPGTLAVHVGDDVSDEDAFEAIGDRGFGIRVGEPGRPTRAAGWLGGPEAVEVFLEAWCQAAGRG
jgi:trehalose-phosphatase